MGRLLSNFNHRRRKIKAGVYRGIQNIEIEDVPKPEITPDGVIIKVKACGICGSDVHSYQSGRGDGRTPGHEFSGDVVEVGANIKSVKPGDRVAVMSGEGCGECYWCQQGNWIKCSKMALLGLRTPGAFAEYVSVPNFELGLYASKLPDSLTYEEGATAEPLSVAWHGVTQVQPQPEDTVVVVGLGPIGLCVVQILKSMGVSQIIASGRRAKRLQLAKESGADIVIDAAKDDVVPIVNELNSGKKADIVFDVAGTEATFRQSMQMVHRGGKVDLIGLYQGGFEWSPTFIVSNDVSLFGCGLRFDIPGAIDLMQSGKVDTKPLITHKFPLEKTKEAFDTQLGVAEAIKVLVTI